MMNRVAKLAFLVVCLSLTSAAWGQQRIATVDLKRLFDNFYKTKQAKATLEERKLEVSKDSKSMRDDYKKAREEYQTLLADANNQALSQDEREKRKQTAEDKFRKLKEAEDSVAQYERQAVARLEEQGRRMHDKILVEINEVVAAKAKAGGYAYVIDSSSEGSSGTKTLLFASGEADLTQGVLDQLNLNAPPDTAVAEEKKNDKSDEKKKK